MRELFLIGNFTELKEEQLLEFKNWLTEELTKGIQIDKEIIDLIPQFELALENIEKPKTENSDG